MVEYLLENRSKDRYLMNVIQPGWQQWLLLAVAERCCKRLPQGNKRLVEIGRLPQVGAFDKFVEVLVETLANFVLILVW